MYKIVTILLLIFILNVYSQFISSSTVIESNQIVYQAEIKGEIINPGVYTISDDETLESLINQAGGLTNDADISHLSLLKEILHEDVIVIPKKTKSKISINSASKEVLMSLSGIGESKAELIIEYRKSNTFKKIEDIMNVKGIGEKIFEKIKDDICL